MKKKILKLCLLYALWLCPAYAEELPEISLRFHAQWDVSEKERAKIIEKYGTSRISFDQMGHAVPHRVEPECIPRWKRLYELCMQDGCYYCDADEGSCETGTCGFKNAQCKPYIDLDGSPKCGLQCADYAFISILPSPGPS
jgi:hypothetical protein